MSLKQLASRLKKVGEGSLANKLLRAAAEQTGASSLKEKRYKDGTIRSWWQMEGMLKREGLLTDEQAIAFFCPVYFAGQAVVRALLDVTDEQGELIMFHLPDITDPQRVEFGVKQMLNLGIKNPTQYLTDDGTHLPIFSSLPGIEGIGSPVVPDYVGYEAVQLGAFMIVPKPWLNRGDPYNESYAFPGEDGYSPFWRVPSFEEFQEIRPDMAKHWMDTDNGMILQKYEKTF